MKQRMIYILILILAFSLAACGGSEDEEPASSNNDDSTAEASSDTDEEEAETSDDSSSAGSANSLTVEVEGGTLVFELPEGWVANTDDGIVIANSDAALAAADNALEAGQIRARIEWVADDSEALAAAGLSNTSPAMPALPAFVQARNTDMVTYEMGTARASIAAGFQQAMSVGTASFDGTVTDATAFAMDMRAGYFLIFAHAPTGEIVQYEGTFRALLASVEFTPAES